MNGWRFRQTTSESTDCAVRVTPLPTGTVIDVTEFETVAENQQRALRRLREALGPAHT
jgi:protein subunit release factor A